MGTALLIAFCSLLMLTGLAGVVLPILPGMPLVWLGLFVYALVTGFETISVAAVVVFFVVMVLALALDFFAPMLGARKYRASRLGMFGAFVGFFVGLAVLNFWGIILGPFAGALIGELIVGRRPGLALNSAWGTFVGFVAGTLLRLVVVLAMIGFFITSFF